MDEKLEPKTVDPESLDLDPGLEVSVSQDSSSPTALSVMGKPWSRLGVHMPFAFKIHLVF